jgi:hypothetical protein
MVIRTVTTLRAANGCMESAAPLDLILLQSRRIDHHRAGPDGSRDDQPRRLRGDQRRADRPDERDAGHRSLGRSVDMVEDRMRIPTKPASDSDQLPATHSDFIPAGIPI